MNLSDALNNALKCQQTGQLSQAEKVCRQVLAADSMQVDAWHILGIVMGQMGRKELAIQYLKEALRLKPDFPEGQINLGNALREAGRLPDAVNAYRRCLELRPDLAEAHYNLGNALSALDEKDKAVESFQAAVRIRPNYVKALNNLGNNLLDLGRLEEAVQAFEKAIEFNPKYVAGLCNLGITLRRLGRPEEAVTHLNKALAIDPKSCPCLNNLGAALSELGRTEEAQAVFNRLNQVNPAYLQDRGGPSAPPPPRTASAMLAALSFDKEIEPLVSVVIPCYNGSAYLKDCLASVQQQKVACEIIVVDDGSKDDSANEARRLLQGSPHAYVVSQANQGPAAARNTGLRLARGKYICFLDVDDQYAPEFCSTAADLMDADPDIAAVCSQIEIIDSHREVEVWQRECIEHSLPSNILMRTEAARQIGGFPTHPAFRGEAAGEDIAFRSHLPAHGKVVKMMKPLMRYRVQRGSHFDFFMDRCRMVDGKMEFTRKSKEETDGSLALARRQYDQAVAQRALATRKA